MKDRKLLFVILLFITWFMIETKRAYLLTGSNIEPRAKYLQDARKIIVEQIGQIITYSNIYESEPWGFSSKVNFLNQVLLVETEHEPEAVLEKILRIEKSLDRQRIKGQYHSRTIDIDILYYEDVTLISNHLILPHPRLHERNFTLLPLVEIAPDFVHPGLNLTNRQLIGISTDASKVWKYEEMNEV